jgi:3-hydroxyisobutyrate dehydrogenase-like beta-hydroxyacid dehydrogenase
MNVSLIGYGEVGRILAEDLRAADHAVAAFDLKLLKLRSPEDVGMRAHARAHGVTLARSHSDAVRRCDLTISAVTASETVPAAQACAGALPAGSFFLDFNSASPAAKSAAAEHVARGAGRYVEGAVMTAVPPYRIKVPLLLGGPHAAALEPLLKELGFTAQVASARLGVASATKMCRSVIIKGLEALVIESFTAARHHGVEDAVLASLAETFPAFDWEKQASYYFQRVIEHGRRRSDEMREAAVTVHDAGLRPWGAAGTAERQSWISELADQGVFGQRGQPSFARSPDWRVEADRILDHLRSAPGAEAADQTAAPGAQVAQAAQAVQTVPSAKAAPGAKAAREK